MSVTINPYLHFNDGKAEEALHFYQSIFDGKLTISRYGDNPGMPTEEESIENLVMHGQLKTDELLLMASDTGPMGDVTAGNNISVSLSGDDETRLTSYFEGLSNGGNVTKPLSKESWGDTFGMVDDKFGISWLVNITLPKE
jgi:PhnB protein